MSFCVCVRGVCVYVMCLYVCARACVCCMAHLLAPACACEAWPGIFETSGQPITGYRPAHTPRARVGLQFKLYERACLTRTCRTCAHISSQLRARGCEAGEFSTGPTWHGE